MTVIHLHNLSKRYRGRTGDIIALGDVSLSVHEGEFVAIRGPSGSGKSTLLLTTAGMIHPTDGKAVVNSTDIYSVSGRERARFRAENIGFVFQMFHLVPYLSVLDNVALPTVLLPGRIRRHEARELLQRFGMSERLTHKPAELSTGERQRTAVARALINHPRLLLADEPTGNLDPDNSAQIFEYLADFHRQGGTVVVVTHDPLVESYAQRTVSLSAGRLLSEEAAR